MQNEITEQNILFAIIVDDMNQMHYLMREGVKEGGRVIIREELIDQTGDPLRVAVRLSDLTARMIKGAFMQRESAQGAFRGVEGKSILAKLNGGTGSAEKSEE